MNNICLFLILLSHNMPNKEIIEKWDKLGYLKDTSGREKILLATALEEMYQKLRQMPDETNFEIYATVRFLIKRRNTILVPHYIFKEYQAKVPRLKTLHQILSADYVEYDVEAEALIEFCNIISGKK